MAIEYTEPLYEPAPPFYSGAIATVKIPPAAVGLGGIVYPIDLKEYRHNALAPFREGVVQSAEPNDQLFDSQGAWWRYRYTWHHGAGQPIADIDEQEANPARFESSRGVDVWTKYQASLLPATELVLAVTAAVVHMATTATHVYVSDGQTVKRSANLTTWNTITGLNAETVVGMTSDGTDCYIAQATDIWKVTPSSVAAAAVTSATPANAFTSVAFMQNRLLAGDGNLLVDVKASTLDVVYTHYQSAFRWTTLFAVGSRGYVGGYSGNRSELFTTTTTDDGSLTLAAEAATFFAGELLNTALSYGGIVILATSKGVRLAQLGGDGTLVYGPLIDAPGNVKAIAAEGRFAWFTWSSFEDGGHGVGRLALDTFIEPLQPAYATDLANAGSGDVTSVIRFAGRTLFGVATVGVYVDSTTEFVESGYIDSGEVYFGTVEEKSITEILARCNELDSDAAISMQVIDAEDDTLLASGTLDTLDGQLLTVNAEGRIVNRIRLRITLTGDGTVSPVLRQWRARAYPVAPGTEEWLVPLIIHSRVIVGEGEGDELSMDTWDEVERIIERWRTKEVVTYQEGQHNHRVRIDNFQINAAKWNDDHDWLEVTCTVRLLSVGNQVVTTANDWAELTDAGILGDIETFLGFPADVVYRAE